MSDRSKVQLSPERKVWLSGVRFWLILLILLVNVALLALVFFMRTDGCVVCLYTKNEAVLQDYKKNVLSADGKEIFVRYQAMNDQELSSLLMSDTHVGFGYSEGDVAASILFERGYDIEPVLKAFDAWPIALFEFSWPEKSGDEQKTVSCKVLSGLSRPIRSAFLKYITHKKAPYRLGYVLAHYAQNGDLELAREALFHKSDVRLWHGFYQTMGLSSEESWKALLAMREEAFQEKPDEKLAVPTLLSYFPKECPHAVARGLVEHRLEECSSLDDETVERLLSLLEEHPYLKAKFCFRLLQVPRKGTMHEVAKTALAELTHDPRIKHLSAEKLMAWVKAAKKACRAPILAAAREEKKNTPSASVPLVQVAKAVVSSKFFAYTVQQGDTIWKIAQKWKVDPNKLISLNGLKKGQIQPGQKLKIPKG